MFAYLFCTKTSLKIESSIENFELWNLITLNHPLITYQLTLITTKIFSVYSHQGTYALYKTFQKTVKRFRSYSNLAKQEFSQAYGWCTIHPTHNVQHFSLFPAKNNDSILRKCWKIFGPFLTLFAQIWANGSFAKKSGSITFLVCWTINLIQKSEKTNKSILQKIS